MRGELSERSNVTGEALKLCLIDRVDKSSRYIIVSDIRMCIKSVDVDTLTQLMQIKANQCGSLASYQSHDQRFGVRNRVRGPSGT
ncbi:MAG: hypothetical protein QXG40_05700 [Ignisphaera sp.]